VPPRERRAENDDVPTPTFPLERTVKSDAPDDNATVKILERDPPVPTTESLEYGVEDPIPTLPLANILKSDDVAYPDEVVVATSKRGRELPYVD
jgi:hypothetical protein